MRSMPLLIAILLAAFAVISFGGQSSEAQFDVDAGKTSAGHNLTVTIPEPPAAATEERSEDARYSSPANSAIMINDARVLLEQGRVNEAEAKLKNVLALDPDARAAYYYLALIKQR